VTPVTLTVDSWWNIEEAYDYGYVLASADGEEWTVLPGQRTRTRQPDRQRARSLATPAPATTTITAARQRGCKRFTI
jgi:bacillopeptidase F (M6 metalloprotease family)